MKKILYVAMIPVILTLFFSCSINSNKYYPVKNHGPRVSTLGFYITPPPGGDWYEKHIDDSLYYFKRTKPTTYALTTKATELVFKDDFSWKGDFLEYVKTEKGLEEVRSDRYRNCTSDYSIEDNLSSLCVRYQRQYDDYGDIRSGRYKYIKVVNNGLVCLHPDSPKVGIDINYMEKSIPQENNPSYINEGEIFLSSLNFLSTKRL